MSEEFELPVNYQGKQHMFKTVLLMIGYTHKLNVEVNDQTITSSQMRKGIIEQ